MKPPPKPQTIFIKKNFSYQTFAITHQKMCFSPFKHWYNTTIHSNIQRSVHARTFFLFYFYKKTLLRKRKTKQYTVIIKHRESHWCVLATFISRSRKKTFFQISFIYFIYQNGVIRM